MTETSDAYFDNLLVRLKTEPDNLDLINSIAIGYFERYDKKTDREDFDFFKKAYEIKRTVKSTHNFAWFLYFEWSEIEWRWSEDTAIENALKIQKECIDLTPQSYYPYFQYGFMLLDQGKFELAIDYLRKASAKSSETDIVHDIGYCQFKLKNYNEARVCFKACIGTGDLEKRSLFNLALTEYCLNKPTLVKEVADELFLSIETNVHQAVSGYEIGYLYFLIGDYKKAALSATKQGVTGIDLLDWEELSYSIFQTDKKFWSDNLKSSISERSEWITEINDGNEDWDFDTEDEKRSRLAEIKQEILTRQILVESGARLPEPNIEEFLMVEHCGCLLFDCKRHAAIFDDN